MSIMSGPWLRIEEDLDGTSIIIVRDDHLRNFPNFMSSVIKQNIGLDRGYFKICFGGSTIPSNNTDGILQFLQSYFTCIAPQTNQIPKPECQTFYSVANHEEVYGFRVNVSRNINQKVMKSSVSNFIQAANKPHTFLIQRNCCLDALNAGGKELLSAHYWSYVRQNSIRNPSAAQCLGQEQLLRLLDEGDRHFENHPGPHQDNFLKHCHIRSSSNETTSVQHIRSKKTAPLLYGSSIPLEMVSFPITDNFNLSELHTILDLNPNVIPGITYPYLYLGTAHATFPYHIEHASLFSLNYLHFGAPCVWFIVPPQDYKKFFDFAHHFKLDLGQVSCSNVLGHKYIMASEEFLNGLGVAVNTVVQKQNEIIVTYPFTPHSGFKCGFNVQQAVNFGDIWWVEPAILAPTCTCFPDQVKLDLTQIIATAKPHLLHLYVSNDMRQLMKELSKNEFIKKLDILPSNYFENVTAFTSTYRKIKSEEEAASTLRKLTKKCVVTRCQLKCPEDSCNKTWAGGRGRSDRVVLHIKNCHEDSPILLQRLAEMYPSKDTTKSVQCSLCSVWMAGNKFHLKRHMRKMHPLQSTC